jgi:hypothetical protein
MVITLNFPLKGLGGSVVDVDREVDVELVEREVEILIEVD